MVRSQIGDEAAFEELLRACPPRLRAYVSRMLGTQHERADDVLQEIWVAVFRALPRLNEVAAFRSWLFRIARDRVCQEFRRRHIVFSAFDDSVGDELAEEMKSRAGPGWRAVALCSCSLVAAVDSSALSELEPDVR